MNSNPSNLQRQVPSRSDLTQIEAVQRTLPHSYRSWAGKRGPVGRGCTLGPPDAGRGMDGGDWLLRAAVGVCA